jgi:hypothetical protein
MGQLFPRKPICQNQDGSGNKEIALEEKVDRKYEGTDAGTRLSGPHLCTAVYIPTGEMALWGVLSSITD